MIWWPRQMPNTGTSPSSAAHALGARRRPRPGSPGPFERNTPSGSRASTSAAGRRRGHDLDLAAGRDELVEDRALDPEVVRDHEVRRVVGPDGVRLGGRDLARRGRGRRCRRRPARPRAARRGRRRRTRRASRPRSRMWRVRRRVSMPAIAGDAVAVEEAVEVVGRAPVRRAPREVAHDHAATERRARSRRRRR